MFESKQSLSHQWWLWWSFLTSNRLLDPIYFVADRHCCPIDFPKSVWNGLIQLNNITLCTICIHLKLAWLNKSRLPSQIFQNDTSMAYRSQFEAKTLDERDNHNIYEFELDALCWFIGDFLLSICSSCSFELKTLPLSNLVVISYPLVLS